VFSRPATTWIPEGGSPRGKHAVIATTIAVMPSARDLSFA
jgi:hypothetical protein